ncbi:hypothetical protein AZA_43426 [Nitrospirillum viridazoti Y2]|uniref:Uncharacterized protein n=1 Tax=Nitrospirillum amazonense TaxID=28077 RepID=A0A560I869_9PROT|nr:hypothetical protein [Nitrospirillum amazonense]EGY00629.1 hypothetical protein AZA_43426 [Nitrospirillum amazonense Y2]TWB54251.1 hypothetical protein FBZ92_11518 [Nitrospirillum amazonense]
MSLPSLPEATGPDIPAAVLAVAAFIALRHTRLGLLPTLAACAMVGVLLGASASVAEHSR